MKTAFAAITALAAVANAYSPGHHMYFPRGNATTTAAPGGDTQTTLTVVHTEVKTVISCAPTVTNCPADKPGITSIPESDRVTNVVTNTVELTKTVCPVSEAGKVSSQVISDHKAGKITGKVIPNPPAQETGNAEVTTVTSKTVILKTVTITMGGKEVPTVLSSTSDQVVTVPKDEPTTTTTATSTMTRTVTIANKAEKTSGGVKAEACNEKPAVIVTVAQTTVTAPASTVYVTVPCGSTDAPKKPEADNGSSGIKEVSNDKPAEKPADKPADKPAEKPADKPAEKPADKPNNDNGQKTTDCPPDVTSTVQATVTVVPVPYPTNGTHTGH